MGREEILLYLCKFTTQRHYSKIVLYGIQTTYLLLSVSSYYSFNFSTQANREAPESRCQIIVTDVSAPFYL